MGSIPVDSTNGILIEQPRRIQQAVKVRAILQEKEWCSFGKLKHAAYR